MTAPKRYIAIVILAISTIPAFAQSGDRLQPGKLYESGQGIYAPRYGFRSAIPEGWEGTLPREMEIFLLMPDSTNVGGEIFTFVSEKSDLQSLRESWIQGVDLSESIRIQSKNEVVVQDEMISSEVVAGGENMNTGNRGFAAAKCSPYGPCITCLGIAPSQFYQEIQTAVTRFMEQASFSEPSNVSPYVDFDWKAFLSGKMLIAFMGIESGSYSGTKENTFHLCNDGTFSGYIQKKGTMKEINPQYKGRQSGTWTAGGIGEHGTLKLSFKKLPALELPLTIKDEKIMVNDERYFAAESDKCRE